jgi:hypothetical protein
MRVLTLHERTPSPKNPYWLQFKLELSRQSTSKAMLPLKILSELCCLDDFHTWGAPNPSKLICSFFYWIRGSRNEEKKGQDKLMLEPKLYKLLEYR